MIFQFAEKLIFNRIKIFQKKAARFSGGSFFAE
jgi:hypothetical protein